MKFVNGVLGVTVLQGDVLISFNPDPDKHPRLGGFDSNRSQQELDGNHLSWGEGGARAVTVRYCSAIAIDSKLGQTYRVGSKAHSSRTSEQSVRTFPSHSKPQRCHSRVETRCSVKGLSGRVVGSRVNGA